MEYKVSELAEKAGVTKRTIHYYISKGLLLPPEGSGVNSVYNDEHLNRLLLIKKLQSEYMPLNKIREYILENPTEEIMSRTGWENITAVKDKAVYSIDANSSSRPTQNIIKALKEMAKAVYPDEFKDK